jgi:hypothetical protein
VAAEQAYSSLLSCSESDAAAPSIQSCPVQSRDLRDEESLCLYSFSE